MRLTGRQNPNSLSLSLSLFLSFSLSLFLSLSEMVAGRSELAQTLVLLFSSCFIRMCNLSSLLWDSPYYICVWSELVDRTWV